MQGLCRTVKFMYNMQEDARPCPGAFGAGGFGYSAAKGRFGLKKFACALGALLLAGSLAAPAALGYQGPAVSCESYIVVDADTGQVIMEKNADEVLYPASITKVMTLALALEKAQGQLDAQLTVSYDSVHQLEYGSSHIALQEGEVVRLEDVLYGTQLESANDGANVLAEYIGGSIQGGVDAMNRKAAELGLANTHYMNPHGLHDEQHYTTAREMAAITRWALTVPGFEEVFCRTDPWTMEPTNKQPQQRVFHCTDWMRLSGDYYRAYAKGSKNGFHDQALTTFVNYAEQDGIRLISVEMRCQQLEDKFRDACSILDYAFENFDRVTLPAPAEAFHLPVVGGGEALGNALVEPEDGQALLHRELDPGAVAVDYQIPDRYVLGQPFEASVTYSLPENDLQPSALGSAKLRVSGVDQVLAASTYVPQEDLKPQADPVGVALAAAALAVLALLGWRLWRRAKASPAPKGYGLTEWEVITRPPAGSPAPPWQQQGEQGAPRSRPKPPGEQ